MAQGVHTVAPPGQHFVRIALVADVPDDLVPRRVKNRMQSHRQFHHAKRRAQVASGLGHRLDDFGAQLIAQLAQLRIRQVAHITRILNAVQKRGRMGGCHDANLVRCVGAG